MANEKRNAFPFDVPAGENRVVWVDVHVPQTRAGGNLSGNRHRNRFGNRHCPRPGYASGVEFRAALHKLARFHFRHGFRDTPAWRTTAAMRPAATTPVSSVCMFCMRAFCSTTGSPPTWSTPVPPVARAGPAIGPTSMRLMALIRRNRSDPSPQGRPADLHPIHLACILLQLRRLGPTFPPKRLVDRTYDYTCDEPPRGAVRGRH